MRTRNWLFQAMTVTAIFIAAGPACDNGPGQPNPPTPGETFTAADGTRFGVQVIATNLEVPWGLAFTPDGRLFFTERTGRVRVFQGGRVLPEPALVLTDIAATGEAGGLGIAMHPQFAENHFVYLVYTYQRPGGGIGNRVVRYRELNNTLAEGVVLVDEIPGANIHDGGRTRFGPDGKLYVTMGDAASENLAQDLGSFAGKILRMNDDGSRPADNPFPSLIYSYGHRNPQGIDWHPATGELWGTEHGSSGNDELNRIVAGGNYGWPTIEGSQSAPGLLPPVLSYSPAVAPSGGSFYTGNAIPSFRFNFFFATLRGLHLHRVRFDPANPRQVGTEERLLVNRFGRIRDVVTGPDGMLYFCTSNRDGRGAPTPDDDRIVRIVPAP